jgi:hypothetical protein
VISKDSSAVAPGDANGEKEGGTVRTAVTANALADVNCLVAAKRPVKEKTSEAEAVELA